RAQCNPRFGRSGNGGVRDRLFLQPTRTGLAENWFMEQMGRVLIVMGVVLAFLGVLLAFGAKLPFRLGRLPFDFSYQPDNFRFYFPLGPSILISVILSLIIALLNRR